MAQFTADPAFRTAHLEPMPYVMSDGIGAMDSVPVKGGMAARFYRIPASTSSSVYIFVFHEWWGLNDHIKKEAEKIAASLGHKANVLAIDLYDGKIATTRDDAAAAMGAVKEDRARAIVKAIVASCGAKATIGTVGWCFGGGWSLQSSLMAGTHASACVIYYGMPEKNVATLKTLHAPVLGIYGSQDQWITPALVKQFEADMHAASKDIEVKMYDADHAFANPSNPKHHAAYTTDAYDRTIAFFKRWLKL
jgi:carboxymethylenebutenolidase